MNRRQTLAALAISLAAVAAPCAFSADDEGMTMAQVQTMANKDGMVTKKDFMAMMDRKWDKMDKANRGMLSVADIMRIFHVNSGGG